MNHGSLLTTAMDGQGIPEMKSLQRLYRDAGVGEMVLAYRTSSGELLEPFMFTYMMGNSKKEKADQAMGVPEVVNERVKEQFLSYVEMNGSEADFKNYKTSFGYLVEEENQGDENAQMYCSYDDGGKSVLIHYIFVQGDWLISSIILR